MSTYLQNIDLVRQVLEGLPHLEERFQFLLDALDEQHPGKIIDEAKCFLESTFRTIDIDHYGDEHRDRIDRLRMPELFTEVGQVVILSDNEIVSHQLREMCDRHFTYIGSIRNAEGAAAHGRDGYHESSTGLAEALYVANIALSIGVLFYSRHRMRGNVSNNKRLKYEDYPEFNNYLDEAQDDITVAGISLIPSDVLFNTDHKAYREALIEFLDRRD